MYHVKVTFKDGMTMNQGWLTFTQAKDFSKVRGNEEDHATITACLNRTGLNEYDLSKIK